MAPKTQTTGGTVLGQMVADRMRQLGISRRQFCIQNNISRQTLYEIEYRGKVNLMTSTLVALDTGLHWEPGTALRYATGDADARNTNTVEERIDDYLGRIIKQISRLTVDELEREAIWLEEELFGRNGSDSMDTMKMVHDALTRLIKSDLHQLGKSGRE